MMKMAVPLVQVRQLAAWEILFMLAGMVLQEEQQALVVLAEEERGQLELVEMLREILLGQGKHCRVVLVGLG